MREIGASTGIWLRPARPPGLAARLALPKHLATAALIAPALVAFAAAPAAALEEDPADWDAIKACEKRLCTMILDKPPQGDDLACTLSKTWPKSTLDGGEGKMVKWGYGDARCTVDLGLERAALVAALTEPKYSYEIPEHKVQCQVESGGEMQDVKIKLAPRIDFKNGKAHKIWINLKEVKGPGSIKATVWTAANVQDTLGVFHKSMLKSVNKFMLKQCAERYGPNAVAADAKPDQKAKKASPKDAAAEKPAQAVAAPVVTAPAMDATAKSSAPAPAPVPAAASEAAKSETPAASPATAVVAPAVALPPVTNEPPAAKAEVTPPPAAGTPDVKILNPATKPAGSTSEPPRSATLPPTPATAAAPTPSPAPAPPKKATAKPAPPTKATAAATAKPAAKPKPEIKAAAPDPIDDDVDQSPWRVPAGKKAAR